MVRFALHTTLTFHLRVWPPGKESFVLSFKTLTETDGKADNTRCWPNVGPMLGQRRRWWPKIETTFDQRLFF